MADFLGASDITNSLQNGISSTPSQAEVGEQKLAEDFQQFLKLLTTQLQNQDPTEPLDTNEFTNQLVMFASVEQQLAQNKNLETLVNLANKSGIDASVGYIGRFIEAPGNSGVLDYTQFFDENGEVQSSGQASFVYDLERSASNTSVSILNSAGQVVFSGEGSGDVGKNVVVWDGVNSFTGERMPEGTYSIAVNATDSTGIEIADTTYTTGKVTAVELGDSGRLQLEVGNLSIDADNVLAVREASSL